MDQTPILLLILIVFIFFTLSLGYTIDKILILFINRKYIEDKVGYLMNIKIPIILTLIGLSYAIYYASTSLESFTVIILYLLLSLLAFGQIRSFLLVIDIVVAYTRKNKDIKQLITRLIFWLSVTGIVWYSYYLLQQEVVLNQI